jgi:hypothetical protein
LTKFAGGFLPDLTYKIDSRQEGMLIISKGVKKTKEDSGERAEAESASPGCEAAAAVKIFSLDESIQSVIETLKERVTLYNSGCVQKQSSAANSISGLADTLSAIHLSPEALEISKSPQSTDGTERVIRGPEPIENTSDITRRDDACFNPSKEFARGWDISKQAVENRIRLACGQRNLGPSDAEQCMAYLCGY